MYGILHLDNVTRLIFLKTYQRIGVKTLRVKNKLLNQLTSWWSIFF